MIGGGGGREWLGLEELGYSLSQSNSADLLLITQLDKWSPTTPFLPVPVVKLAVEFESEI